jgi:hypothetical protein
MKHFILYLMLLAALPNAASAQSSTAGTPTSSAASKLDLAAGNPIIRPAGWNGKPQFRFTLRALSSTDEKIPVAVVQDDQYQREVFDWTAFTSAGARCHMQLDTFVGAPAFFGRDAEFRDTSGQPAIVEKVRPTIVSGDFACDDQLEPGDTVTVQLSFLVRVGRNWETATFAFQNMPLEKR